MLNYIDLGLFALFAIVSLAIKRKGGTYENPDPFWGSMLVIAPHAVMETSLFIYAVTFLVPNVNLHFYEVLAIFVGVQLLFYGSPYQFMTIKTRGAYREAWAKFGRVREMKRETKKRKKENADKALGNQNLQSWLANGGDE